MSEEFLNSRLDDHDGGTFITLEHDTRTHETFDAMETVGADVYSKALARRIIASFNYCQGANVAFLEKNVNGAFLDSFRQETVRFDSAFDVERESACDATPFDEPYEDEEEPFKSNNIRREEWRYRFAERAMLKTIEKWADVLTPDQIADGAVTMADAMLARLDKPEGYGR